LKRDGDELFDHYRHTLEQFGAGKGMLTLIFNKAQNKFQDPARLRRLVVDLIDAENWSAMGADVKRDANEGLLERPMPWRAGWPTWTHAALWRATSRLR
jgi:type I restriction enzyme M protein